MISESYEIVTHECPEVSLSRTIVFPFSLIRKELSWNSRKIRSVLPKDAQNFLSWLAMIKFPHYPCHHTRRPK